MEETREQFFAELKNDCIVLGAHAAEDRRMLRLQKASSWFMAAYALQPLTEGAFYSFPWCIAHVLLEAKWWLRQTYPCEFSSLALVWSPGLAPPCPVLPCPALT